MVCRSSVLVCALSLFLLAPAQAQSRASAADAAYGRLPMHFEENRGQIDSAVRFVARGAGYAFFITDTETVAVLKKAILRMQLIGASEHPHVEGDELFEGKSHYLLGSDRAKWRMNVPQFGRVRIAEVYEGIDVVYYGNNGEIEYDFVVAPRSDPRQIRMHFEGAERIETDASGDLVLHLEDGEVRQRAPFAYQERGGLRQVVQACYRQLGARDFGIALGAYDPSLPLVIDPVLVWSTYLGGNGRDAANAIAVDAAGNAYVTGETSSTNFPVANALQATLATDFNTDAFVTKFNAAGSALVYSTYLGGTRYDAGAGIAVDGAGNVYVAGLTESTNFPTANAIQAANGGILDAFAAKLNAAGTALVYSTYLGGSGSDTASAIALDLSGNAYVAGRTESTNFPIANPVQAANAGGSDAFVTKLNAAGSALVYSTYLGGSSWDWGTDVAADGNGSAYVTGYTASTNFPTANALQAVNAGIEDAFVAKLNAAGSALVYSTYLGGTSQDIAYGIAVDGAANAYVAGHTESTNFPTANALQAVNAGVSDAFVLKLNAAGTAFVYSTYLGGSGTDAANAVAVHSSGSASVTGRTTSANFPLVNAVQAALAGSSDAFLEQSDSPVSTDAFVTKLNAAGTALVDSTYLRGSGTGSGTESGYGIAVDSAGSMYVAGVTTSTNFPTANAVQASNGFVEDGFVAKLGASSALAAAGAPMLDGRMLMLLAALLASAGLWMVAKKAG